MANLKKKFIKWGIASIFFVSLGIALALGISSPTLQETTAAFEGKTTITEITKTIPSELKFTIFLAVFAAAGLSVSKTVFSGRDYFKISREVSQIEKTL